MWNVKFKTSVLENVFNFLMCNRDPAITAYSDSTICFACERRQKWGSARLSSGCIFAMSFEQSFTLSNFPLLTAESLARAGPGYRRSAQLCLPASVRLFIPGCTCVFVGMWRVAKLHKGVWVCGVQVHFVALCVTASQNTTRTPFTHHSSIPLRCHLSTPEAFPEHTTNKVGQVHGWALFLSESNFQEVPTGKRVPAASDNRTMTRSFPSPLTSAELNHMPQFSKSSAQPLHRTPQICTSLLSVPELILIT